MTPALIWESLSGTYPVNRAKVIGGWLIMAESTIYGAEMIVNVNSSAQTNNSRDSYTQSITFIPDPQHMWDKLAEVDFLITKETHSSHG